MISGYVLHRWEYDDSFRVHRCISPRVGDVPSYGSCLGCGLEITDEQIVNAGLTLDMIAFIGGSKGRFCQHPLARYFGPRDRHDHDC